MSTKQFSPRRTSPNAEITFSASGGVHVRLQADEEGIVHPRNEAEEEAATVLDLPIARKELAEQKESKP